MHPGNTMRRLLGFTLLELVIVLTLLATVVAIAAPQLAGFMAGRNVNEEARRLLSVTDWARSEAISRGLLMEVWFDVEANAYGVRPETSDPLEEAPDLEFQCFDGVSLEVDPENLDEEQIARIVFWPDGAVDAGSVHRVELSEEDKSVWALALDETGMQFALENLSDAQENES